MVKKLYVDML